MLSSGVSAGPRRARLSLSSLPVRRPVPLLPVPGTAEDNGLLWPPPEVVDAVEVAVVVLSDVAPLVTGRCETEEANLLAPVAGRKSGQGCVK